MGTRASKHSPTIVSAVGQSSRRVVDLGTHGAPALLRCSNLCTPLLFLLLWFVGEEEKFSNKQPDRVLVSRPVLGPQMLCVCVLHGLV